MAEKEMLEKRIIEIIEIIFDKKSHADLQNINHILCNTIAILTTEIVKLQVEIENLKCYVYKD